MVLVVPLALVIVFFSMEKVVQVPVQQVTQAASSVMKKIPRNNIFRGLKSTVLSLRKDVDTASIHPRLNRGFLEAFNKNTVILAIVGILVILAGVGTGWLIAGRPSGSKGPSSAGAPGAKTGAKEAGIADEATFRDSAEGIMEEGGVDGEGTHHLTRPGGPSQNVYLTSTVIDLQAFVGKKIKVWGETISARKAGWLMDVGKVKVLE